MKTDDVRAVPDVTGRLRELIEGIADEGLDEDERLIQGCELAMEVEMLIPALASWLANYERVSIAQECGGPDMDAYADYGLSERALYVSLRGAKETPDAR
jgi:hypothetical protein